MAILIKHEWNEGKQGGQYTQQKSSILATQVVEEWRGEERSNSTKRVSLYFISVLVFRMLESMGIELTINPWPAMALPLFNP